MPSTNTPSLVLLAPISGLATPLEKVPDPTFAQKMVGDGVAIDPTEERLVSPCAGRVTLLHSSLHALTITTDFGLEILMHVGLETVLLKGRGFKALVREGQTVAVGDPLILFDADYVVKNAKSLLTILAIANVERVLGLKATLGYVVAKETTILTATLLADALGGAAMEIPEKELVTDPIVILNPAGLHARPSAVLANHAKRYKSAIYLEKVEGGAKANAKSVISVMGLEVKAHDRVVLRATGDDAVEALTELGPLLAAGLGENLHGEPVTPPKPKAPKKVSANPKILLGVSASPGLALGEVYQLRYQDIAVTEKGQNPEDENESLRAAIKKASLELKELQNDLRKKAESGKAAIFAAHEEILEDPELLSSAAQGIALGQSAAFAWRKAFTSQAESLAKLNNELLAGRANDVRDVGRRVLLNLTDAKTTTVELPANAILVAEDLTPSDTASLDKSKIQGFAITGGSATSHASILARAANLPAIAAIEERALEIPTGTLAILDGAKGELRLFPTEEEVAAVQKVRQEAEELRRQELSAALAEAVTLDEHKVKVVGNVGGLAEATEIPKLGGEGVGLLRSEFLFLRRATAPDQNEQEAVYVAIAKALGPNRDLVVRTLDVGGDKPLAYLPLPHEVNPFLGVRGIRLNLLGTDLFRGQIRAILKAAPYSKLHIMFPMVTNVAEFQEARDLVLEEKKALSITEEVKIGLMVEVPAAALLAYELAQEADFFSIGTNDLTQYALAIDRGHPKLAKMADALHPAVLKLIDQTVKGAHAFGKWVGVCGGVAGEVVAGPVLVGLGVDELSVSVGSIPAIKALVRRLNFSQCQTIAQKALSLRSGAEVRAYLAQEIG
ncbi:MAG: phosphoenolpyruvate--protein phosphotransferase [Deltaproteobacteria bacterium]|jgi:phosphocarrier protein FPr|nr:phosphoenolpyruvate--protein phosphotransferase [Deltaproteobacteria bacterium]